MFAWTWRGCDERSADRARAAVVGWWGAVQNANLMLGIEETAGLV